MLKNLSKEQLNKIYEDIIKELYVFDFISDLDDMSVEDFEIDDKNYSFDMIHCAVELDEDVSFTYSAFKEFEARLNCEYGIKINDIDVSNGFYKNMVLEFTFYM